MAKTRRAQVTDERIGQRLKHLRDERGWEQTDVAARLQVQGHAKSPATISNWERGKTSINLHDLWALADVFGVSVQTLSARLGLCGSEDSAPAGQNVEWQELLEQAASLSPDLTNQIMGVFRALVTLDTGGQPSRTN